MKVFIKGLVPRTTLNSRMHWAARARSVKKQRQAVRIHLLSAKPVPLPVVVTLTRCAPRMLDSDNCAGAMKATRDEVAAWLGADDGDPRFTWRVAQRKSKKGEAGTEIQVEQGAAKVPRATASVPDDWEES